MCECLVTSGVGGINDMHQCVGFSGCASWMPETGVPSLYAALHSADTRPYVLLMMMSACSRVSNARACTHVQVVPLPCVSFGVWG